MQLKTKFRKILSCAFIIIALAVVSCTTLPEPSATIQNLLVGEITIDVKNYDVKLDNRISINGTNTEGITLSITNYQSKITTKIKSDKQGFFYSTDLPAGNYYISNILLERTALTSSGTTSFHISINPSAETLFVLKPKSVTNIGKIVWEADAKKNNNVSPKENYNNVKSRLASLYPETKWLSENWIPVKVAHLNDFEFDVTESAADQVMKPRTHPDDFKNSSMEKIVRQIPKTIIDRQRSDPDGFLEELGAFLTKDSPNTFESVKRLHDWVADNIAYDAPSFFAGRIPNQNYQAVLNSRLAVCAGYANLFKKLCDLKGIPCTVVSGYSRGYGSSVFSNENPDNPNHAWNIVTINQKYYLVDTTWDAGYLEGNGFKKHYSTGYLFADPTAFLHSHYPSDSKNQLLSNPLDARSFSLLPALNSFYFSTGIVCLTKIERVNRLGNDFSLQFKIPEKADLKFSVYGSADGEELQGASFKQQEGDTVTVRVALPGPGNYTLKVFKHEEKDFGETYIGCGEIGFIADGTSQSRYPVAAPGFLKGYQLLAPMGTALTPGKDVAFRLKLPDVMSAFITIDNRQFTFYREESGIFSIMVFIPASVSSVYISKSKSDDNSREDILQFPIQKK